MGPGRQIRDDFSNGPGRAGKWGIILPTGRAGPAKREMSFLTAMSTKKEDEKLYESVWTEKTKTKF